LFAHLTKCRPSSFAGWLRCATSRLRDPIGLARFADIRIDDIVFLI
jgi:hypothetical protein